MCSSRRIDRADPELQVPDMKSIIEAVKQTSESLAAKQEGLDDEINDRFDHLVALVEQRRTNMLNQLHFKASAKREKLGKFSFFSFLSLSL